jgi:hypothetical protein
VLEIGGSTGKIKCNYTSLITFMILILRTDECHTVTETYILYKFRINAVTLIKMVEYRGAEIDRVRNKM